MNRLPLMAVPAVLALAVSAHAAEFSLTPRFGYYFDNTSQRQSAVDYSILRDPVADQEEKDFVESLGGTAQFGEFDTASNYSQLAFPQFGGTVTFAFDTHPATQYAFTALYGKTSGGGTELIQRFRFFYVLDTPIRDTQVTAVYNTADYSRLDLEATVQHRLNETFSFIGGARAERFNNQGLESFATTQSFHLYNAIVDLYPLPLPPRYQIPDPLLPEKYRVTSWTYSGRVGAAAFAPVGEKHLFYVNGLLQLSYYRAGARYFTRNEGSGVGSTGSGAAYQSETTVGPDISVGYMYRLSDRFGFDIRYRATVYFTVSGPSDFKDSRVNHGVGMGFTTWFGR